MYSTLELCWTDRTSAGGGATRRRFLDFVVDGVSLYNAISKHHDYISFLGWSGMSDLEDDDIRRLLGEAEPNASEGHSTIYICPECGDIGCGAITVRAEKVGNEVVWADFAYEYTDYALPAGEDLADSFQILSPIDTLGRYTFEYGQLRQVFENRVLLPKALD